MSLNEHPGKPLFSADSASGRDSHGHNRGSGAAQRVLLFNPREVSLTAVLEVISDCGAVPYRLATLSAVDIRSLPTQCTVAVVILKQPLGTADLGLSTVSLLGKERFQTICLGEGASAWPLCDRSRVLLAGSKILLDTVAIGFKKKFHAILSRVLQAETERQVEEESVFAAMAEVGMVGRSRTTLSLFRRVLRISKLSDIPVLLTGETGTGKDLLAEVLHRLDGKRREGPYIAVNAAAIPPELAETELFGHRRGAYTGAERDRRGLFRSADKGILFLDEIGEMSPVIQAKFLRVLQAQRVLGVGQDCEVAVDVRVVAATNRDLSVLIREKVFREDLYHRLNVLSIHIPPLRDRPEDIGPLVEHFLRKNRSLRQGKILSAEPEFVDILTRVDLPGNVRQLENIVRGILAERENDASLTLFDLPPEILLQVATPGIKDLDFREAESASGSTEQLEGELSSRLLFHMERCGSNLARTLKDCERLLVKTILHLTGGNQTETARRLRISPRSVYNLIRRHRLGLSLPKGTAIP